MVQTFEVSNETGVWDGHPWGLVRTQSDRLLCFFYEGTHHLSAAYDRGMYVISDDRGRTWSEKRPLTRPAYHQSENPSYGVGNPEVLADGRIVVPTTEQHPVGADPGPRRRQTDTALWTSDDEGESWTGPRETGIEGDSGYLVELSDHHDNRWVIATLERFEETHEYEQRVQTYVSDDEGETWDGPNEIVTDHDHPLVDTGDDSLNTTFGETSLVELPEGELVAFVRENSRQTLDLFKAISTDGGETWDGPYPMPIPCAQKPMAGMLNSGRVLITYRFAQGGGGPFLGWQNTFSALTDVGSCLATNRDDAWANILPLDHDDAGFVSDTGYTDWVQFDDGEIYVVNYRVGSEADPERAKEPPGHDKRQKRASVVGYAFYEDEFQPQELPAEVVNYDRAEEEVIRDWARRTGYEIQE